MDATHFIVRTCEKVSLERLFVMQPTYTDKTVSLKAPKPVASYLAAEKAKDADMLVLCFADDALKAWKKETEAKYRYVMEPLDASVNENIVKLRARLTGDFPGSPVELDYTFTVANDKITSLGD